MLRIPFMNARLLAAERFAGAVGRLRFPQQFTSLRAFIHPSSSAARVAGNISFANPADSQLRATFSCSAHQAPSAAAAQSMTEASMTEASMTEAPYQIKPLADGLPFGQVYDFSLSQPLVREVIDQIKLDVAKYQVLVFRDQGVVSGDEQVRISSWFGELESTFYKHPMSPHPDVFRVSNNRQEGCTGWHIDGSFMREPFSHSVYHIISAPTAGSTVFADLYGIVAELSTEQTARWERLWAVADRRSGEPYPVIYSHPETGRRTMCFHTGMTDALVWDYDTPRKRVASRMETLQLLDELDAIFRGPIGQKHTYHHVWQPGDFILSDNLAVAHEADPSTQLPVQQVGLRVMHRCTIKGKHRPEKHYEVEAAAE